ncbi:hypothetical protein [Streptomyces sp. NPDC003015]
MARDGRSPPRLVTALAVLWLVFISTPDTLELAAIAARAARRAVT